MDYKDLADLIFPDAKPIKYYEEKYPERNLPEGAMVVIEAEHTCMTMRVIKKPGTKTVTTTYRGVFRENIELRKEVRHFIK